MTELQDKQTHKRSILNIANQMESLSVETRLTYVRCNGESEGKYKRL